MEHPRRTQEQMRTGKGRKMIYIHKWQKKEHGGAVWKVSAKPGNFWAEWENDETVVLCHTAGDNSRKTKHHNSKSHLKRKMVFKHCVKFWQTNQGYLSNMGKGGEILHYYRSIDSHILPCRSSFIRTITLWMRKQKRGWGAGKGEQKLWKGFYYQDIYIYIYIYLLPISKEISWE